MSFRTSTALALTLLGFGGAAAQASSLVYNAGCSLSTGANDFHQSGTPGQTMTAELPGNCFASNASTYSSMQLYASSSPFSASVAVTGTAYTAMQVEFYLFNPSLAANTIIPDLYIRVGYDFSLGAAAGTSGGGQPGFNTYSAFDLRRTNDQVAQFRVSSTSDVFGGNSCPSPLATYPQCNGNYSGYVDVPLVGPARVNSNGPGGIGPNVFRLAVTIFANNNAITDAAHTIIFPGTVLPDGTTFGYSDLTGNPLGFGVETNSAVPEPGTILLSMAGLAVIFMRRGVKSKRRPLN